MPRLYGQVYCSIWDDPSFCALGAGAQRTYFMLITQPDITACGTLPLTLRRWSKTCRESDPGWLDELTEAGFVLVDEDTEELLVRTFAKHDGGYRHAVRQKAVVATARAVKSPVLRCTVVDELGKLGLSIDTDVALESHPSATRGTGQAPESQRFPVPLGDHRLEPETPNHEREPRPVVEDDPLSPFCPPHQPDGPPGACRDCGTRRVARQYRSEAEQRVAEEAKLTRLEKIRNCSRCNENGFIEGPAGELIGACSHSAPPGLVAV